MPDLGLFGLALAPVVCSADVGYRKPHRLMFEAALEGLGHDDGSWSAIASRTMSWAQRPWGSPGAKAEWAGSHGGGEWGRLTNR
jgi:FMN phosphatase YigB (HAD superfamily)